MFKIKKPTIYLGINSVDVDLDIRTEKGHIMAAEARLHLCDELALKIAQALGAPDPFPVNFHVTVNGLPPVPFRREAMN